MHKLAILLCSLGALPILSSQADVRVPHVLGDNMVLQREKPVPVWGWADAGEAVTVSFNGQTVQTVAADDGKWMVTLQPMDAKAEPGAVVIKGNNELRLENVLVGEVWLCSGQSNMEFAVNSSVNAQEEIAAADWPLIREIKMSKEPSTTPVDDRNASWQICSPASVGSFTACGYFFGRKLHKELGVPIGLLNSSWGGTRIEPWTPPVGFEGVESLAAISQRIASADPKNPVYQKKMGEYVSGVEAWVAGARVAVRNGDALAVLPTMPGDLQPFNSHQDPTMLYNGMIHPLLPFALRGSIWYQGESNHNESDYTAKTRALVEGWRKVWNEPELPYYFVQIAPFEYGNEDPEILARFWEQQAAVVKKVPHTGMVVISDIGNIKDIHPKNKQDVGLRLALQALAQTYGKKDLVFSGPRFKEMKVEGKKIRVSFDHAGTGLVSRDGQPLTHWEILGEGTGWEKADAVIDGNDSVLVSSAKVETPLSVRFAWHKLAEPNLMNKEGMPTAPFRAGDVQQPNVLNLHFKEAKEHQLVYDLDLSELADTPRYAVDNSAKLAGKAFQRVAYFLEIQRANEPLHYAAVSMDAFTQDATKLAIPTVASGARFQQPVKNLSVKTDVPGVTTGENLPGGYIEFWPNNYGTPNIAKVAGASDTVYDFGDEPIEPPQGYGSMQVHNIEAKQTVFAINKWNAGDAADFGIGNSPGETKDWTFTSSAAGCSVKRMRVFVR